MDKGFTMCVINTDGTNLNIALQFDCHEYQYRCIRKIGWVDNDTVWFALKGGTYKQIDLDSLNGGRNLRPYNPK